MSTIGTSELRVVCDTPDATQAFGAELAGIAAPGDVFILAGELGAGKTTLVKGVVGALGGNDEVTSPTFVLCHLYETDPIVAHVDCWRLDNPDEVFELALEEVLDDGGIAFVEWGDRAGGQLGTGCARIELRLAHDIEKSNGVALAKRADGSPARARIVTFAASGPRWDERVAALTKAVAHNSALSLENGHDDTVDKDGSQ